MLKAPMDRLSYTSLILTVVAGGCTQTLDAGSNRPHGRLPVDERNPLVLVNDGAADNWQGEYAVLLANGGGPPLAGIVVNASKPWPDLDANVAGWRDLVSAARASGLRNIPDPIASIGRPLVRPASGDIEATLPNRSEGARLIVDVSKRLGLPYRPLVVVTGGSLTDVADAYLLDRTVAERVVVVSSLGLMNNAGAGMGIPNGDEDPWADTIVASRLRYVQVSAFYDQLSDVPDASVGRLPANALGARMAAKQPNLWEWQPASDQVSVLAVGIASFATEIQSVTVAPPVGAGATAGPDLATDPDGARWLVTGCEGAAAATRLWELLTNPSTFSH
jgi:hypothetical protein